jgi:N-terminal domain of anti-restriction factor ArdC
MTTRNPAGSARHANDPGRQAQLAAPRDRVLAQVRAIRSGEEWAAWLRLAARLRGHSFANILLIAAQRPAASLVASYEDWRGLGRQVGKASTASRSSPNPVVPGTPDWWRRSGCARARSR